MTPLWSESPWIVMILTDLIDLAPCRDAQELVLRCVMGMRACWIVHFMCRSHVYTDCTHGKSVISQKSALKG